MTRMFIEHLLYVSPAQNQRCRTLPSCSRDPMFLFQVFLFVWGKGRDIKQIITELHAKLHFVFKYCEDKLERATGEYNNFWRRSDKASLRKCHVSWDMEGQEVSNENERLKEEAKSFLGKWQSMNNILSERKHSSPEHRSPNFILITYNNQLKIWTLQYLFVGYLLTYKQYTYTVVFIFCG